ncbi:MAG TPA: GGDEF domain-containing protein [Caldimonas sp.]|jgi:diguanylate cyclase (GGDEF)-like protein|nr:GGDEF domain-containing protein [Caldimonas sp.]HEX2542611.1 GGDEF domain-containing protein [Caldimonas sp.]
MSLHSPSLLLAVAVTLFVASAASAGISLRQRARRGAWWWIAANTLLVVSLGLQASAADFPFAAPLALICALQWPIVTLAGVRHFFSRGPALVPPWADWLALGLAGLASVGAWFAPVTLVTAEHAFAASALVLTLYAAAAVSRLEDFGRTSTLKTLLVALVAAALAQAMWFSLSTTLLEPPAGPDAPVMGALMALAALALLLTQLCLAMNHERHIAHLRASQRKLRHLVDVDALTRLPNRRHFHELAEAAVQAAPELATVLVFDVDRLKRINELLGHATGDEALRQIGTALRETLRRRDVAGRLGGDEFAVVLPRTREGDAASVVQRLNARINDRQVAPRIAKVLLNVGTTQMLAGETLADALRRAEAALELARDAARLSAAQAAETLAALQLPDPKVPATTTAATLNAIPVGDVVLSGAR